MVLLYITPSVPLPFCGVGFGPVCNVLGSALVLLPPHAPGTPVHGAEDRVWMVCCADKSTGNKKSANNMKRRSVGLIFIGIK